MYITVTIPAIRTVVTPVEGVDTREDQIEALRVLSAGNTLIIVLLGGVLALQVRERRVFFMASGGQLTHSSFFFWRLGATARTPVFFFFGARHAHTRGDRSGRGDWK